MFDKYYDHVVNNKNLWVPGFTLNRLNKVRLMVMEDQDILSDLLIRHGGKFIDPDELKLVDKDRYYHAIDNFVCSILYKMMDNNIIKK